MCLFYIMNAIGVSCKNYDNTVLRIYSTVIDNFLSTIYDYFNTYFRSGIPYYQNIDCVEECNNCIVTIRNDDFTISIINIIETNKMSEFINFLNSIGDMQTINLIEIIKNIIEEKCLYHFGVPNDYSKKIISNVDRAILVCVKAIHNRLLTEI